MTTEVGVAFVRIVPTFKGGSREISKGMTTGLKGPAGKAGEEAGDALSDGVAKGTSRNKGKFRGSFERVGGIFKLAMGAAGIAGAALLATGLTNALEVEAATDKLEAQLGGGQFAADMGEIAGNLYMDAFGESITETGEAVRKVLQAGLLPEDATNAQIESMTAKALTFADVLDQDLSMATQAVSNMIRTGIAEDSSQAFDILTRGIQQGGDRAEDLLETFQEYSVQFQALGLDAQDATGLMVQGLKAGARDADTTADALKELAIRGKDGSTASAEGFKLLGLSAEDMTEKFAAGGDTARAALGEVIDALQDTESQTDRNNASVALFGTKSEDLQKALMALDLDTAAAGLGDVEGSTDKLGSAYDNAATKIESFKRKALDKVTTFIGGSVIPGIERLADVLGPVLSTGLESARDLFDSIDFEGILGTVTMLADAFQAAFSGEGITSDGLVGTVEGIGVALREAFDAIRPAFEFLVSNGDIVKGALLGIGIAIAAVVVPALVAMAASMIVAAAPFILVALAAAAVGAALVWLFNNVEGFRNFVMEALPQVGQIFLDVFELIKTIIRTAVSIAMALWRTFGDDIIAVAKIAWNLITGIIRGGLDIIQGIIRLVTSILKGDWSGAWDAIKQITRGALTIIGSIFRAAWGLIKVGVSLLWRAVKALFRAGLNTLKTLVRIQINRVADFFRSLKGKIRSAFSTLSRVITAPFRSAFNSIKSLWNRTVGGFGFSIPSWVPGVGGKNFRIPSMHTGGIVGGTGDQLILARGGEGVFTREQMAAIGAGSVGSATAPTQVVIRADNLDRALLEWLRRSVRVEGGGNVQTALGQR